MNVKKFFALIIALSIAVSITLTACGGNSAGVGEIISFGGYDWRVLEVKDGKALLLSENIIEERAYHLEWESITWADSSIREYLNGEFYNTFSDEDKARIIETQVVNDNNPWYGTDGGEETTDNMFLLSLDEVVEYFGDSGQLAGKPDDTYYIDDEYNDSRVAYDGEGEASWWWLRSSGRSSDYTAIVYNGGYVYVYGSYVRDARGGVRPALWLSL